MASMDQIPTQDLHEIQGRRFEAKDTAVNPQPGSINK